MQPDVQLQHKLPKVYLKPFGYKENRSWYISVLERSSRETQQMDISTFTAEENIFDYSILPDIEDRRHFEKLCSKFEAQYPSIIKSVKTGSLSENQWFILCQFMATLMARSDSQRRFYTDLISKPHTRNRFFDEITILKNEYRSDLDFFTWTFSRQESLQFIAVVAGEHIAKCLTNFTYIILRSPTGDVKKWFTSDDPVVVDKQNMYGYLIPIEAEIYFPMTKDYCLFMYHEDSQIQNHPLRHLEKQKVHDCDDVSHAYISMRVMENAHKYLLIPKKLEQIYNDKIPISNLPLLRI